MNHVSDPLASDFFNSLLEGMVSWPLSLLLCPYPQLRAIE